MFTRFAAIIRFILVNIRILRLLIDAPYFIFKRLIKIWCGACRPKHFLHLKRLICRDFWRKLNLPVGASFFILIPTANVSCNEESLLLISVLHHWRNNLQIAYLGSARVVPNGSSLVLFISARYQSHFSVNSFRRKLSESFKV